MKQMINLRLTSKHIIIVLLLLIIIPNVQARLGRFDQNTCVNIRTILNSSFVNISSIGDENGTVLVSNQVMTRNGLSFNYSFCNTSGLGVYTYDYFNDQNEVFVNDFLITKPGGELNTSTSLMYILFIIIVFSLFVINLFFAITIPYSHKRNEVGGIIQLTKKKYVKLFFIMLSYVSLVWVLNILIGISDNFLGLGFFFGLVSFLFNILNSLAYIFIIFILIVGIFEFFRDIPIAKMIRDFGSFEK